MRFVKLKDKNCMKVVLFNYQSQALRHVRNNLIKYPLKERMALLELQRKPLTLPSVFKRHMTFHFFYAGNGWRVPSGGGL